MTLEQILALNPGLIHLCFIQDNHYVLNNPEKRFGQHFQGLNRDG